MSLLPPLVNQAWEENFFFLFFKNLKLIGQSPQALFSFLLANCTIKII